MSFKLLFAIVLVAVGSSAQWLGHPSPGVPRLKDGKPNLSAKTPRTREGKPDLSGLWHPETTSNEEIRKYLGPDFDFQGTIGMEIGTISKYGLTLWPENPLGMGLMTPAGEAVFARRFSVEGKPVPEILPATHCLPLGIPLASNLSEVTKIVQAPGITIVLLELNNSYRQIYTDGRKLPENPSPTWMGYSVGKWVGDTFVVETTGFNDQGWIDGIGHPQSESMHLTERYTRRDVGHMDIEYTFNDPKFYVKPFTVKIPHLLKADSDILEYVCGENEKDRAHMGLK